MIKLITLLNEDNNFEQITTILDYKQAKKLVYDECKQNYETSISKNRWIYRGINTDFAFAYVDGTRINRSSIGSYGNIYNEIIDNSPQWDGYPKRHNSIICTTNRSTATEFGRHKYVVIPFDSMDNKICVLSNEDIFYSFRYLAKHLLIPNLESFNYFFDNFVKQFLPKTYQKELNNYTIVDIKRIMEYIVNNKDVLISRIKKNDARFIYNKITFIEFCELDLNALYDLFDPQKNDVELMSYSQLINFISVADNIHEIYFSGECLLIDETSKLDFTYK